MVRKLGLILVALGLIFGPVGHSVEAKSVKRVVIDPGHGGSDPGATGNGLQEKDLTLLISQKVNKNLLDHYAVETLMTRNSDVSIPLKARTDLANSWGANLFLSIHINAGGGTGYEDYIHSTASATSEDKKVQAAINKEIEQVLLEYNLKNRGQKKANFQVLRDSKMASVLLEILFIDTKADADLLKRDVFLNDIAEAISKGVANALALQKVENNSGNNPSGNLPTYIVTASSLNVRSGNGTHYSIVGSLKKDEQVQVTDTASNGWYQIVFNGKLAYVSSDYLKAKPQASNPAPKPSTPVSSTNGIYIVTATSLNVRSGNGTNYATIGSLKKNEQVTVTGKTSNNWYKINYKGKTGYVSGDYLKTKPQTSNPTSKPGASVSNTSGVYVVTASSLNVRLGNSTSTSIIGSLARGSKVSVTGKTANGWYRIIYKGKVGYVSGNYLKQ